MGKYHLRRQDRQIEDRDEVNAIIARGKYAVLAMCVDNEPYIVTLSYGYDNAANVLYFHGSREGQKLDFIRKNPNVCAAIMEDRGYKHGECGHEYATVVIRGSVSILEDLDAKKHGVEIILRHLENNPEAIKETQIKDDTAFDKITVLKLHIEEITGKKGR